MASRLGLLLNQRSSFWSFYHAQEFTYTVSQSFLTSLTFHVINPHNHIAKGDRVSIKLPVSAVSGLKDEAILALLTKGYFGGWVFAIEAFVMRTFGGVLPARYKALQDKPTKKIVWRSADIPKDSLLPIGDMLWDFGLVDKHIQTTSNPALSYVDYGFGSDARNFAGSHRFVVNRKEQNHNFGQESRDEKKLGQKARKDDDGYIELYVECFRCNPMVNRDSWAEWMPWLHYWYARLLWAEAVKTVLRR